MMGLGVKNVTLSLQVPVLSSLLWSTHPFFPKSCPPRQRTGDRVAPPRCSHVSDSGTPQKLRAPPRPFGVSPPRRPTGWIVRGARGGRASGGRSFVVESLGLSHRSASTWPAEARPWTARGGAASSARSPCGLGGHGRDPAEAGTAPPRSTACPVGSVSHTVCSQSLLLPARWSFLCPEQSEGPARAEGPGPRRLAVHSTAGSAERPSFQRAGLPGSRPHRVHHLLLHATLLYQSMPLPLRVGWNF